MTKKSMKNSLKRNMQPLETEMLSLKKTTAKLHSSKTYQTEIKRMPTHFLLERISDGVTVLNQQGEILFINQSARNQFGYSAQDLVGQNIGKLVTSVDGNADYLGLINKVIEDQLPKTGVYALTLKNDKRLTLHLDFTLKKDPASSESHIWVVHRDLTRIRELEKDLKSSRQRLDHLFEHICDIVLNIDPNGSILFINSVSLNKNPEELIGKDIYGYIIPEDQKRMQLVINQVFNSGDGGVCQSVGIALEGVVRWYSIHITPIKHDNQVIAATLNARDHSEKKETEDELRNSQTLLESVLHSIPGTLLVLDKKLNIVASNLYGLQKFSFTNPGGENICYQTCWQKSEPCHECYVKQVFASGIPIKQELYDDQVKSHKEIQAYPVLNEQGNTRYVIEHVQDISKGHPPKIKEEVSEMKSEAIQQLKTDFLAKISHELKTPMIGILGFSKLGKERYKQLTKEKLKNYFSTIYESGEKLQSMLNNLIDLSQLEISSMTYDFQQEKLSMVTTIILNEMFTHLKANQITVDFERPNFSDQVSVDVDRIGKVIRNLLTNAITFSKPNTTIKIRICERAGQIEFSVADTGGNNLPEKDLTLIVESLNQKAETGLEESDRSLGFAIAKKIIADHQGKIWLEQNQPEGLIFKFLLPKAN